ncbi:response regulator [Verticiella sediminum]|uniref:response regulator n=1 Tax=Verticiella sediminum TaxID=1247510 RepID=UPI001478CFA0|nr:response regulator [Verticiella sediminum]
MWLPRATANDGLKPWPLRGLRVLLVDDSHETLEAFSALLRLEGAQVCTAQGGAEAVLRADAQDFDLILSDIGMPGMDGYALIRALRERPRTRDVPAFALSGFGDREGIERALKGGFQAYLPKPVTLEALREAMGRTRRGGPLEDVET